MSEAERINNAIRIGLEYGQTDGAHHKTWAIDQMLRALLGDDYERAIDDYCGNDYEWDTGIAP